MLQDFLFPPAVAFIEYETCQASVLEDTSRFTLL